MLLIFLPNRISAGLGIVLGIGIVLCSCRWKNQGFDCDVSQNFELTRANGDKLLLPGSYLREQLLCIEVVLKTGWLVTFKTHFLTLYLCLYFR